MANKSIAISKYWAPVDISNIIKPFVYNAAGTAVNCNARADVIKCLSEALNHLSCYTVRLLYGRCNQQIYSGTRFFEYSEITWPLLSWYYNDTSPMILDRLISIIYRPRVSANPEYASYATFASMPAAYQQLQLHTSDGSVKYSDSESGSIKYTPQSITGAPDELGFYYETNATTVVIAFFDICCQEMPRLGFASYDGTYQNTTSPGLAKVTKAITVTPIESIRSKLHALRSGNMPLAFVWSAESVDESPSIDGISNATATFQNIFNTNYDTRSTTSPGIFCDAFAAGLGNATTVNVRVYVYAEVVSGSGTVRISGPNGDLDISITATSPTWVDGGTLTLNTDRDWDYSTDGDWNKIDILIKEDAASDTIRLRAISAWLEY